MKATAADEAAMRAALEQARLALPSGDVPVGALVLGPDGDVVGAGCNRREADTDPTAHAEVLALRAAARALRRWRLEGCTLVATLEPCAMCAGAAVLARVDRVVFGAFDAKAGAVGSLWDLVRDPRLNHRPEVASGVLAEECSALLRAFFAEQRGDPGRSGAEPVAGHGGRRDESVAGPGTAGPRRRLPRQGTEPAEP